MKHGYHSFLYGYANVGIRPSICIYTGLKTVLQNHTAIINQQRHVLFTVLSLLVGTLSPVPALKRL
jgi:hypothetical protein